MAYFTCFPETEVLPSPFPPVCSPNLEEANVGAIEDPESLLVNLKALETELNKKNINCTNQEEVLDEEAPHQFQEQFPQDNPFELENEYEDDSTHDPYDGIIMQGFQFTSPLSNNSCSLNARRTSKRKGPALKAKQYEKKSRPNGVHIRERETPKKPPRDNKEYRVITLSNGLQAVLIKKESPQQRCSGNLAQRSKPQLNAFMEGEERQKLLEKQKHLPSNFPGILPLGMQQPLYELAKYFPTTESPDVASEAQNMETQDSYDMEEYIPAPDFPDNINDIDEGGLGGGGDADRAMGNKPPAPVLQRSSIAFVVNVGITDDPKDCKGLAHFTEHMVHYGSEKYPKEGEYFSFALNYGSGFNAFTENHTTTYYNTVPNSCLKKGLDMLSSMLSEPRFDADMTQREVNSVDSEFHLKRHIEFLRRWFLFQTALKPEHPLGRFGFGNSETLLEKNGIQKTLREFHAKYYVASSMTLGIESTLSLDEQEQLVLDYCSQIPTGSRKTVKEMPATGQEEKAVGTCFNKYYIIQGLCTFSNIWIAWPIPDSMFNEADNKTFTLVCNLIGDESEGGLAHALAKDGYIWLMLVHNPIDQGLMNNKYNTYLTIDFFLTEKGRSSPLHIMETLFSYLEHLRNTPESKIKQLFDELKLNEQRFFNSGITKSSSAMAAATALQHRDAQDILLTDNWEWQTATFCSRDVKSILRELKQTNMIVIQTIPSSVKLQDMAKGSQIYVAPYTDAEYIVKTGFPNLSGKNSYRFGRQQENIFLQGVGRIPLQHGIILPQPLTLPDVSSMKVMAANHLGNIQNESIGSCTINLLSPSPTSNARNYALSLLWTTSVMFHLLPLLKKSSQAGLSFSAIPHPAGITLLVRGFTEKLLDMLEKLTDQLLEQEIAEDKFLVAKNCLLFLYDLIFANNYQQISDDLLQYMTSNNPVVIKSDALLQIKESTLSDVNSFRWWIKREAIGAVLVMGNVPLSSADKIAEIINKQNFYPYFAVVPWIKTLMSGSASESSMPVGERCIRIKSDTCTSYTTTVSNFYYTGKSHPCGRKALSRQEEYILWHSSLCFFRAQAFLTLRTKKQLGYDVRSYFPKADSDGPIVFGVSVTATASKFSPCELDEAIDDFMYEYGVFLNELDEREYNAVKAIQGDDSGVTLDLARAWYQLHTPVWTPANRKKDPNRYHYLGMSKVSIQFLGSVSKECQGKCEVCEDITGWKRGNTWNNLQFAQGNESRKSYFIDDPKSIRDGKAY